MNNEEARIAALDFLKKNKTGVLATVSLAGEPHATLLYYVCDDSFNIYFSTLESTRKFAAISKNPHAAFTVATVEIPQTLQMEGVVTEVTDEIKIHEGVAKLLQILESNNTYYWPITKMDGGRIVLMKFSPTWIRWGDFAYQEMNHVFTEIPSVA